MSTIVGHALAAAVTTRFAAPAHVPRPRALVAAAAVAAVLPDLDVPVFMALRPLGMTAHRGLTHSLAFALASATALTLLSLRLVRLPPARLWAVLALAALSHLLLDVLMGAGPPLRLLAPLSDRGFLLPWRAVPVAYYGTTWDVWLAPSFWVVNALALALEVVVLLPLLAIGTDRSRSTRLALAVSAGGLLLTYAIYN